MAGVRRTRRSSSRVRRVICPPPVGRTASRGAHHELLRARRRYATGLGDGSGGDGRRQPAGRRNRRSGSGGRLVTCSVRLSSCSACRLADPAKRTYLLAGWSRSMKSSTSRISTSPSRVRCRNSDGPMLTSRGWLRVVLAWSASAWRLANVEGATQCASCALTCRRGRRGSMVGVGSVAGRLLLNTGHHEQRVLGVGSAAEPEATRLGRHVTPQRYALHVHAGVTRTLTAHVGRGSPVG